MSDKYEPVESLEHSLTGEKVSIRGVVSCIKTKSYMGCKHCQQKSCNCKVEKTRIIIQDVELINDSGIITMFSLRPKYESPNFEKGELIEVRGLVMKDSKRGLCLNVDYKKDVRK